MHNILSKSQVLFADLHKHGIPLIWYLLTHNIKIVHIISYNDTLYTINLGKTQIKCYTNFGCELGPSGLAGVASSLLTLEEFCVETVGLSLKHTSVNSAAGIMVAWAKKLKINLFCELSPLQMAGVTEAYCGGRCEVFAPGKHAGVYMHDVSAMYGNLMLQAYPQKYTWRDKNALRLGGGVCGVCECANKIWRLYL